MFIRITDVAFRIYEGRKCIFVRGLYFLAMAKLILAESYEWTICLDSKVLNFSCQ